MEITSKNTTVVNLFVNQVVVLGMALTIFMSIGDHSVLHELLADATLITGTLSLMAKKPLKILLFVIIAILVAIAYFTNGFS